MLFLYAANQTRRSSRLQNIQQRNTPREPTLLAKDHVRKPKRAISIASTQHPRSHGMLRAETNIALKMANDIKNTPSAAFKNDSTKYEANIGKESSSNQNRSRECDAENQTSSASTANTVDKRSNSPHISVLTSKKVAFMHMHSHQQISYRAHSNPKVTTHNQEQADNKPFECEICFEHFSSRFQLGYHSRCHFEQFPFCCVKCGRRFGDESKQQSHMNQCRPYKCGTCGVGFGYKHHLKQHETSHLSQFKFYCSICRSGFVFEIDKNHHERKCHDRQYECHVCKHSTLRLANLQEHIRIHHTGAKPSGCFN